MDTQTIILTGFNCLFGATGLFTYIRLLRKDKTDLFKMMQMAYKGFIEDTNSEIAQMREEIKMLHDIVQGYRDKCQKCINNTEATK